LIQFVGQFPFLASDDNTTLCGEVFSRCNLMIVSVFAQARTTWHDNDSFPKLERGNNGAHAGMRNHKACCLHAVAELARVDKPLGADMFGAVARRTRLREDVSYSA